MECYYQRFSFSNQLNKRRVSAFQSRGSLWSIAEKTGNPERALSNLLERDRLFTSQLQELTDETDVPVIKVDSSMTESDLENRVAMQFGLRSGKQEWIASSFRS